MKTSLTETKLIEHYLLKLEEPSDRLLTEVKMSLNQDFAQEVFAQKSAYALITRYGRSKLRGEIKAVEKQLFELPRYRKFKSTILRLFLK
jgi:flagellar basal body-associated protein FliL